MESVQERMQRLGTKNKIAYFIAKEKEPYEFKRRYARIRAEEFARECDGRELNYHVSVGGLDSIVLYLFLHEICGIDAPGVSASSLEDKSIQRVHKALGIINVPPLKRKDGSFWTKAKVIQEFIKDNGTIILFANGMFTADLMHSNRKLWKYNLIWQKTQPTGFLNAKKMPLRSHEDICIFYKKPPTYNPQMTDGHERKVSKAAHHVNAKESSSKNVAD